MRFYFFQTAQINRGNGPQPTLRALPNQTFPDGTPVETDLNVSAPKEAGSSANGSRLDYPDGTYFCSDFLKEVTTNNGVRYYTVFDTDHGVSPTGGSDPNFHPVTDDNNTFKYVKPQHKSDLMNIAFVKFMATGDQGFEENPKKATKKGKKGSSQKAGPADINGKARSAEPTFEPKYDDQLDIETELIVQWMKKLLNDTGIKMPAKRPKNDSITSGKIEELYRCGESLDTITSRPRFAAICKAQKIDRVGLENINKGPFEWYLDQLLIEHTKNSECTAVTKDPASKEQMEDIAFLVSKEMDSLYGTSNPPSCDPSVIPNITKAVASGWTVDELINPDVLNQKDNIIQLADDLATGVIPLPNKGKVGKSLFEEISSNPKYKCPKAKDGFEVKEAIWKLLIRNLKVKQNTLLTGPSGSGKTELVKKLCEVTNTPLTIIAMGGVTDVTEHLVGKLDLDPATGGTKFDWAEFALAIQRPGIILLDEINRIPRGGANILYSVLDNTRTLHANGAKSTDVREIKVNPECCFFATANIGSEFVDANEIDEALRTRMCAQIPLDFMDVRTEAKVLSARTSIDLEDAMAIAEVAADIRREVKKQTLEYNVSVRETLYTAELVRDGLDVEEALEYGFLVHYEKGLTENDPNSQWGQVKALIASHFNAPKAQKN